MTPTTTNGALVAQIRQAIQNAHAQGQPPPGRPTLVALTGATDHAVRKALSELATQGASRTSTAPAGEPTSPATDQAADQPAPAPPARTTAGEPTAELPDSGTLQATHSEGPVGGKLTAWTGFVFGSVTSVAANVLAARIPPAHAGPRWTPNVFAELGAAVWPLALLLSVEVLSRVRWPATWQWKLAKFGGIVAVALGSAVISYGHIRAVLASWNYTPTGAGVGPLVVDGLMVISGFALLAMSHHHTTASPGDQPDTRKRRNP